MYQSALITTIIYNNFKFIVRSQKFTYKVQSAWLMCLFQNAKGLASQFSVCPVFYDHILMGEKTCSNKVLRKSVS